MGSEESPADVSAMQQELDELRERNRKLESEGGSGGHHHTMGSIAHSTLVVFLLVLGTLCITLAPVTIWGRNLVLNTDRYVATLKPVASNPGVQNLIINAIDKQAEANIDIKSIVSQTLPPRAVVLEAPLQSAVNGLVNVVATRFVQSPAFETLWVQINPGGPYPDRLPAHRTPLSNAALNLSSSGDIVLDLAPVMQQVKTELVSAGLGVAQNIPVVGTTIVIGQAKGLSSARKAVRALEHRRRRAALARAVVLRRRHPCRATPTTHAHRVVAVHGRGHDLHRPGAVDRPSCLSRPRPHRSAATRHRAVPVRHAGPLPAGRDPDRARDIAPRRLHRMGVRAGTVCRSPAAAHQVGLAVDRRSH